ncbi:MAG TPA: NAD(P)-dependent glycerol-3-phosphate dehydrogenase [Planctomycetes bacterium]|nr:NAD(P)-dependent glycerol-3-phosphate dehydrogenase [Planctomycetota bacterium]
MSVLIAGSGSWGAALACVLRSREEPVTVLCRRRERAEQISSRRHSLLPELELASGIEVAVIGEDPIPAADLVISTVPTQDLRKYLLALDGILPTGIPWVSASKGLEMETHSLPSQIIKEAGIEGPIAILSGPSHAEEVVREVPTLVTLAHSDSSVSTALQERLSAPAFRIYRSTDAVGVEWGGALKNVIALACGIAIGQGFGDNTLSALVTRGSVEMSRLGVSLGGLRETFSGLSGVGDLIVTCFSEHSRNRAVGIRIGHGEKIEDILDGMDQVAEGVHTTLAVHEMRKEIAAEIEMPIAETVYQIVHEGVDVEGGTRMLLRRSLRAE